MRALRVKYQLIMSWYRLECLRDQRGIAAFSHTAGRAVDCSAFSTFTCLRFPSDSLNRLIRQVCSCSDATAGLPAAKTPKITFKHLSSKTVWLKAILYFTSSRLIRWWWKRRWNVCSERWSLVLCAPSPAPGFYPPWLIFKEMSGKFVTASDVWRF